MAAVFALTKYKQYVGQEYFELITDSRALCALKTASNLAGKLARWSFFLEEFNMKITHKSGATLTNADGLSRCATNHDDPSDADISLEAVANLEEEQWEDDIEVMLLDDVDACLSVDGEIMETNLLQKLCKTYPCSSCDNQIGNEKYKVYSACGEARHVKCMPNKPPVGYWFC